MKPLGYSPIRYTKHWPPVSGSQPPHTQRRKPHSKVYTEIPSGIKYRIHSVLNIPDDIGIGVTTGSNSRGACDCNQLTSKIERLTDENRMLSDVLDRHIEIEKNPKMKGGSRRRFKRTLPLRRSIRRRSRSHSRKSKQNKRK